MPNNARLDRVYARLLQDHPYGWALYKKVTAQELYPGCCGYFDSDGDWRLLLDLTIDQDSLTKEGWIAPGPGDQIKTGDEKPMRLTWGPKKSKSVVSRQIGGELAVNVASPISPSVTLSFTCESDEGAVLTTQNPVLRHRVGNESAVVRWMKANRAEMLRRHKEIAERHGIWVVSKTYTTTRSGVAVMSSKSSAVEIGIGATVPGVVTLTPSSSWSSSKGDLAAEIHDHSEGVVVFMSGVYFCKKLFKSELKLVVERDDQKSKIFRGGYVESDDEEQDEGGEDDGDGFEIRII
ncbi:uncharacterized protein C8A04DRAFT_30144 [Dichotomopilus funicola]|uniref:Uncharacterized protein n=1 Tax=Dichotomopilus funicola TaxID=1934379 RepID=A0AAN6UZN7_9PEZI|nr:hypothetical protein C8A04DRAFT_30144 [Dichotomopilus funicola]